MSSIMVNGTFIKMGIVFAVVYIVFAFIGNNYHYGAERINGRHDRMPLILSREDEQKWLDKEQSVEDLKAIL